MSVSDNASHDLQVAMTRLFARKRMFAIALPAVILAYFAYIFVAFDVAGLADRARLDMPES
jgi:phosphonate transport system permease protein